MNFTVMRENTEGAYVNAGGVFKKGTADEIATQEEFHTRKGVERIIALLLITPRPQPGQRSA